VRPYRPDWRLQAWLIAEDRLVDQHSQEIDPAKRNKLAQDADYLLQKGSAGRSSITCVPRRAGGSSGASR